MLVDSHAHLDGEEFNSDREDVLRRAAAAGVGSILCPLEISNPRSVQTGLALAAAHPEVRLAAGLHPHEAKRFTPDALADVRRLAGEGKIAAVGEIGLDFHYHFSTPEEQCAAFRAQLDLARELGLPAVIHSRNAGEDILRAVREEGLERGVLHCFSESWDVAATAIAAGLFISFSGIVTFPKARDLREVVRRVPIDRLLVETDAPYLAPVPYRGQRNEPAYVVETAKTIASLIKTSLDDLARTTTANFRSLFR
jgi:TatD DNase family protein